jgi:hypothetical protein
MGRGIGVEGAILRDPDSHLADCSGGTPALHSTAATGWLTPCRATETISSRDMLATSPATKRLARPIFRTSMRSF